MAEVLHLIGSLQPGSQSRQLLALVPALAAHGVASTVLVLAGPSPWGQQATQGGISIEELGLTSVFDVPEFLHLRRRLRGLRDTIVHAWGPTSVRVARVCGVPASRLIVSGVFPSQARLGWLDRHLFRETLAVDFSTSALEAYRQVGWNPQRTHFLRPGLPDPGEPVRGPLPGLAESDRVLMGVGPLDLRKGFRDAVYALDMLRHLDDRVKLVLLGDGDAREALNALVEAFGAERSVLRPGWQPNLHPWLCRADIVLAPLHGRGGVYGVLDAMLAARPIVAAAVPDLVEILDHDVTGLLVPTSERMQLARECRFLLQDPDRCQRLGQAARQAALQQYPIATLAESLWQIYQKLA